MAAPEWPALTEVTALHMAVLAGHEVIVANLIAKGATLDLEDDEGRTPLHIALYLNEPEIATMLIDAGAAVDTASSFDEGSTPLHLAVIGEHEDIRKAWYSGLEGSDGKPTFDKRERTWHGGGGGSGCG